MNVVVEYPGEYGIDWDGMIEFSSPLTKGGASVVKIWDANGDEMLADEMSDTFKGQVKKFLKSEEFTQMFQDSE